MSTWRNSSRSTKSCSSVQWDPTEIMSSANYPTGKRKKDDWNGGKDILSGNLSGFWIFPDFLKIFIFQWFYQYFLTKCLVYFLKMIFFPEIYPVSGFFPDFLKIFKWLKLYFLTEYLVQVIKIIFFFSGNPSNFWIFLFAENFCINKILKKIYLTR